MFSFRHNNGREYSLELGIKRCTWSITKQKLSNLRLHQASASGNADHGEIVLETQSAFIPGRMITDNAIIAFECFHKIQHSRNNHDAHCAYKLDLAKAYDWVDWSFLEGTLLKIGFLQKMDRLGDAMCEISKVLNKV